MQKFIFTFFMNLTFFHSTIISRSYFISLYHIRSLCWLFMNSFHFFSPISSWFFNFFFQDFIMNSPNSFTNVWPVFDTMHFLKNASFFHTFIESYFNFFSQIYVFFSYKLIELYLFSVFFYIFYFFSTIFFTFSQILHLFLRIHVFSPHIYYFFHLFISFFTTFFMNLLCFSFFTFFTFFHFFPNILLLLH